MDTHAPRHFPLFQATAAKFSAKPLSCWHESRIRRILNVVKGVSVKIGERFYTEACRGKFRPVREWGSLDRPRAIVRRWPWFAP